MRLVSGSSPAPKFLVFRIDGIDYVLPMTAIREVLLPKDLKAHGPGNPGPAHFRVSARGAEIPVVYFGRPKRLGPRNRVILLQEVAAGVLVDSVSRVEEIPVEDHVNGRVRLAGKWRAVFDAVRLVNWALEQAKAV